MRSKSTDLTLIPLIQWQVQQDDGQWRDLKAPKDRWFRESFNTFTLNITIEHGITVKKVCSSDKCLGLSIIAGKMELVNAKKMIEFQNMRVYDELLELDIVENEKSLR